MFLTILSFLFNILNIQCAKYSPYRGLLPKGFVIVKNITDFIFFLIPIYFCWIYIFVFADYSLVNSTEFLCKKDSKTFISIIILNYYYIIVYIFYGLHEVFQFHM